MLEEAGAIEGLHPDVDVIFHLAAQTNATASDAEPFEDFDANVEPVMGLIEEFRRAERKPFIVFAGAATQVGAPSGPPLVDERIPDAPLTTYDLHKCMAELALEHACRRGWARGCTLRLANVYGPSPAESGPDRGVLNRMIRKATKGETVEVYGSGDWIRDYVFIDDVCRAFMLAAANQDTTNGRHFVIGSGVGHSLRGVALMASLGRVEHVTPPAPLGVLDTRSAVMDSTAFLRATGWHADVDIERGIGLTRDHYLEHA